jgi:hypothetical protein
MTDRKGAGDAKLIPKAVKLVRCLLPAAACCSEAALVHQLHGCTALFGSEGFLPELVLLVRHCVGCYTCSDLSVASWLRCCCCCLPSPPPPHTQELEAEAKRQEEEGKAEGAALPAGKTADEVGACTGHALAVVQGRADACRPHTLPGPQHCEGWQRCQLRSLLPRDIPAAARHLPNSTYGHTTCTHTTQLHHFTPHPLNPPSSPGLSAFLRAAHGRCV